jgi:DNA-binding MarR family transcriptional regulator
MKVVPDSWAVTVLVVTSETTGKTLVRTEFWNMASVVGLVSHLYRPGLLFLRECVTCLHKMPARPINPILRFREIAVASGIHTLSQLAILEQIRRGYMAGDLAQVLGMQRSSLDVALRSLYTLGLIDKAAEGSGADRRTRPITRSVDGDKLLVRLHEVFTPL